MGQEEAAVATATNPIILTLHYYDVMPHELEQTKMEKLPKSSLVDGNP